MSSTYLNRVPIKKLSVSLNTLPLPFPIHGLVGFILLYIVFDWVRKALSFLSSISCSSSVDENKKNQDFEVSPKTVDDGSVSREEVEIVLGRLGMSFCHSEAAKLQGRFDSDDMLELFGEDQNEDEGKSVDIDEERAAFDVFDENRDGFIDERELQRVLLVLGMKEEGRELSKCRSMIMAFDENGDGKIDFHEFSKLIS